MLKLPFHILNYSTVERCSTECIAIYPHCSYLQYHSFYNSCLHSIIMNSNVLAQRRIVSAVSSRDIRTSMSSEKSLHAPSMAHARSTRDLVRGERRSVQPRYNFAVDKNDLSENIDDSIQNFDSFSQFCAQYAQQDDQIGSQEGLEDGTTPTNSETPKDNTSLIFNQTRYDVIFMKQQEYMLHTTISSK